MRTLAGLVLATLIASPAWATGAGAPAATTHPSVAQTASLEFLGKRFERKWQSIGGPVRRYEYYPARETPDDWFELTEFQVYPIRTTGNEPRDFAVRIANDLKRRYPAMRFGLFHDKTTDAYILEFFYPTSTRKDPGKRYLEFDAFKFFHDPTSDHVLAFHYAKNIEAPGESRPSAKVIAEIRTTIRQVVNAMAHFGIYRP
jgi:hypothetical protein